MSPRRSHTVRAARTGRAHSREAGILILSDPKGGEEALGRAFHAFAFAEDAETAGDEVQVLFAGAGTRWPAELTKLGHPVAAPS